MGDNQKKKRKINTKKMQQEKVFTEEEKRVLRAYLFFKANRGIITFLFIATSFLFVSWATGGLEEMMSVGNGNNNNLTQIKTDIRSRVPLINGEISSQRWQSKTKKMNQQMPSFPNHYEPSRNLPTQTKIAKLKDDKSNEDESQDKQAGDDVCLTGGVELISFNAPFICALSYVRVIAALGSDSFPFQDILDKYRNTMAILLQNIVNLQSIPSDIISLSNLVFLVCDFSITAPIPSEIGALSLNLLMLVNHESSLQTIPNEIGNAQQLKRISFSSNEMTGTVPSTIGLIGECVSLDLDLNSFTGTIPTQIGNFSLLTYLDFSQNLFTGPLPTQLGLCTSLEKLVIGKNLLNSSIPKEFNRSYNMTYLDFSVNQLHGSLPSELGVMTLLTYFSLSTNGFEGTIPSELGEFVDLEVFDLSINRFNGSYPSFIFSNLLELSINNNAFTGTLPSEIGLSTALTKLSAHDNLFQGQIPSELGRLSFLIELDISNNKFSGTIPIELYFSISLKTINVEQNQFTGYIPAELEKKWTNCDYSGLRNEQCALECYPCALGEIQIKGCQSNGHGQQCLAAYIFLAVLVPLFLIIGFTLMKLSASGTKKKDLIIQTILALFSVVDILIDLLYVFGSSGVTKTISVCFVFGYLLFNFYNAIKEFGVLTLVDKDFHLRAANNHTYFTFFLTLCTFSPQTLPFLANYKDDEIDFKLRLNIHLVAFFYHDISQLIFQLVSKSQEPVFRTSLLFAFAFTGASIILHIGLLIGLLIRKLRQLNNTHK
eukprot:c15675_g1_i1.p1 GENE.c15675_g1_i1~~c15675_g1_i1.p1  ORF type:complete len:770 (+),score=288.49 c15675_g1_i1:1-2310(+)